MQRSVGDKNACWDEGGIFSGEFLWDFSKS